MWEHGRAGRLALVKDTRRGSELPEQNNWLEYDLMAIEMCVSLTKMIAALHLWQSILAFSRYDSIFTVPLTYFFLFVVRQTRRISAHLVADSTFQPLQSFNLYPFPVLAAQHNMSAAFAFWAPSDLENILSSFQATHLCARLHRSFFGALLS